MSLKIGPAQLSWEDLEQTFPRNDEKCCIQAWGIYSLLESVLPCLQAIAGNGIGVNKVLDRPFTSVEISFAGAS